MLYAVLVCCIVDGRRVEGTFDRRQSEKTTHYIPVQHLFYTTSVAFVFDKQRPRETIHRETGLFVPGGARTRPFSVVVCLKINDSVMLFLSLFCSRPGRHPIGRNKYVRMTVTENERERPTRYRTVPVLVGLQEATRNSYCNLLINQEGLL